MNIDVLFNYRYRQLVVDYSRVIIIHIIYYIIIYKYIVLRCTHNDAYIIMHTALLHTAASCIYIGR